MFICFFPLKTKKIAFLLYISKSRGAKAHGYSGQVYLVICICEINVREAIATIQLVQIFCKWQRMTIYLQLWVNSH